MMKLSIHRALAELKVIDARIKKQICEIQPSGVMQKGKLVNQAITEEDFSANSVAKMDSIMALIERKSILKSAIVQANAVTKVIVADKEMTIADAINFKAGIALKKELISSLKSQYAITLRDLQNKNSIVESNLQKILEATFGKDNVKVSKEDVDAIRKPFLEANEWKLVDPLDITKKIEKMEQNIEAFESEVDAVLSEINAITLIEV